MWVYLCRLVNIHQDPEFPNIAMYLSYPPYNQARALLPRTCLGPQFRSTIHFKRKKDLESWQPQKSSGCPNYDSKINMVFSS